MLSLDVNKSENKKKLKIWIKFSSLFDSYLINSIKKSKKKNYKHNRELGVFASEIKKITKINTTYLKEKEKNEE